MEDSVLTKHGLHSLLRPKMAGQLSTTIQVILIQEIVSPVPPGAPSYRIRLSDGEHYVQGLLSSNLDRLVTQQQLVVNGLLKIEDYRCAQILGKNVVIVRQATPLPCPAPGIMIGSPVDVNVDTVPVSAEHPQVAALATAKVPARKPNFASSSSSSTINNAAAAVALTPGGVRTLVEQPEKGPIVVQVISISPTEVKNGQRHALVLSDGEQHVFAMPSNDCLSIVPQLQANRLLRIEQYYHHIVAGNHLVLLLEATALPQIMDRRIGLPVPYGTTPAPGLPNNTSSTPSTANTTGQKRATAARVSLSPIMKSGALTQQIVEIDDSDGEQEETALLARTQFNIVGIKYYQGVVHKNEFVTLVREPHNPYDCNAVRVDNMRGIKVGHIKRAQALVLAEIMDNQPKVKVEGTISGDSDGWSYPVMIEFSGISDDTARREPLFDGIVKTLRDTFRQSLCRHPVSWFRGSEERTASAHLPVNPVVVERKAHDWKQEQKVLDDMFDKQTKEQLSNLPQIAMPTQFKNVSLYSHQIQGIRWLVNNETSLKPPPFYKQVTEQGRQVWLCEITQCSHPEQRNWIRGGILADEMGLGKTLQTIGLILAAPPPGHKYPSGDDPRQTPAAIDLLDKKPAAVRLYTAQLPSAAEIRKKKVDKLRNVLARAGLDKLGRKADIVATILSKIEQGVITAVHFDESTPVPQVTASISAISKEKAPIATLIVAPVSVLSNWVHQVKNHVKEGVLRVAIYQGPDRQSLIPAIQNNQVDIVLVSYHTLASDYTQCYEKDKTKEASSGKKRKITSIFDATFHRIVLDEAHTVRSQKTSLFKSCLMIQAERKLALTGTPFVNSPDDIHSLFAFLNLTPLADKNTFRKSITSPIQVGDDIGLARLRAALAHVALRRSKALTDIQLVNKEVQLRAITFPDGPDKALYELLFKVLRAAIRAVMLGGKSAALQRYSSVLEILLRMRQACCSGLLVPEERREAALQVWQEFEKRDKSVPLTPEEGQKLLEKLASALGEGNEELKECAICLEELDDSVAVVLKTCSHVFCYGCISKVAATSHKCPLCRSNFQKCDIVKKNEAVAALNQQRDEAPLAKAISFGENWASSPKIVALLEAIKEMQPDEKAVIFSQFTSFLDIVAKTFDASGLAFSRIDGRMNANKRSKAMNDFSSDDSSCRFILCSLHAAGTGINLARGNVVFMLDCWWNQSVENQAMDRVHRLGQRRHVRVVRFVMKDSIEERMVKIQESKNTQAKGAFAKLTDSEKRVSRLRDLRQLMEIPPDNDAEL